MASSVFEIREHVLECQHIREYARATAYSQEDVLKLAVKQYIPLDNPKPTQGDVTIIGAHANGFPKELYEPLWEDIHACSKSQGFNIRNIWIADTANQGASGVLNEQLLGNDPSWNDHVRDLLHLTNVFRHEMPQPIIGIGHSFGSTILLNLSLIHPRLFTTLVILDPVIVPSSGVMTFSGVPALSSTYRRDLWPSRSLATASFHKSKFYQRWDPRVLSRWCEFGVRETPTPLYPDSRGEVTLTTTKHQECFTFVRPSWDGRDENGNINRKALPDVDPTVIYKAPFYQPEPPITLNRLPEIRPSVFYIFGSESDMSFPAAVEQKLNVTGSGLGGSGGKKEGRVDGVLLEGVGHLVAMEACEKCASFSVEWIGREMLRYEKERREYEEWTKKSFAEKTNLSEKWKRSMGPLPGRKVSKTKL